MTEGYGTLDGEGELEDSMVGLVGGGGGGGPVQCWKLEGLAGSGGVTFLPSHEKTNPKVVCIS